MARFKDSGKNVIFNSLKLREKSALEMALLSH
jgi:hypothetical protein